MRNGSIVAGNQKAMKLFCMAQTKDVGEYHAPIARALPPDGKIINMQGLNIDPDTEARLKNIKFYVAWCLPYI